MKKTLVLLFSLSILFWITAASNCWVSWNCSTSSSKQEVTQAKKALWNKASIFESLIPLFKAKDKETQDAVRALLVIFKSSRDPYTRNIWIYFEYLIEIAYWAEESDSNSSDNNQDSEDSDSNNNNQEENNTPVSNWTISIASTSSSSVVIREGSNAELISFSVTVKDSNYNLKNLEANFWGNTNGIWSTTLEIDWSAVETARISSDKISFNNLNESLAVWKHTFTLKANVSSGKFTVEKVTIGKWSNALTKSFGNTRLVAKAYPTLSSKVDLDDLIIKIANPSDSDEDIRILGFAIKWWSISSASIDNKNIDLKQWVNKSISNMWIELAPWDSTELRLQASKDTVQVNAIKISVDWSIYVITNDYTNIGKRSSFKVTYKDWAGNWMPINTYVNSNGTDIIGVDYQTDSNTNEDGNGNGNGNDDNDNDDNDNNYQPTSELSIAASNSTSTVELEWNYAEIMTVKVTVKNGLYDLWKLNINVTNLQNTNLCLLIDWLSIDCALAWKSSIEFNNLNEVLSVWAHSISINWNINSNNTPITNVSSIEISDKYWRTVQKDLNIKKFFAKGYPVLAVVKKDSNSNEITIKISNPSSMNEDFIIKRFTFNDPSAIASISLNDQSLQNPTSSNYLIESSKRYTLAPGESTELRFQVAADKTAKLEWIWYNIEWTLYNIWSEYTNIAKRSDLKITYKK